MRSAPSIDTLDLLVDRAASYDLKCGICFSLLQSPVQCRHGHLFCSACMAKVENCPECRVVCSAETVARALFVEKTLSVLKIHCLYRFFENGKEDVKGGCPAVLVISEQDAHQAECKYRWVHCKHCDQVVRMHTLEAHEAACEQRFVRCQHCGSNVRFVELEKHENGCSDAPVECLLCKEPVMRRQLVVHSRNDCLEEIVPCPFEGCSAEPMKRSQVEEHYRRDAFVHLNAMQRMLQEQLLLQNRLLKTKDDRISALETQMLRERKGKMKNTIVWRLHRWPQLIRSGERFVRSKSFQAHPGFDFFFGMFPFGEGDGTLETGKMSIYLFLEKGAPDNALIEVEFSIALVNNQYEAATVSSYHENVAFPLTTGEGWGSEGVIGTKYVTPASGFLTQGPDHSLVINGTFRVINLSYDL